MDKKNSISSFKSAIIDRFINTNQHNTLDRSTIPAANDFAGVSLHQIARDGDVLSMEKYLERISHPQQRKKRINIKDEEKWTPLHYAAKLNHCDVVEFLLKNGAKVDSKDEDGSTPIHIIARTKKKSDKRNLLGLSSSNEKKKKENAGETSDNLSSKCLRILLEHGGNVNERDGGGLTPLHHASLKENTHIIKELLGVSELNVEEKDFQGLTALHHACIHGFFETAQILIKAGANLRSRDKASTTPFHFACSEGKLELAKLLLDKADQEADIKIQSTKIETINENFQPAKNVTGNAEFTITDDEENEIVEDFSQKDSDKSTARQSIGKTTSENVSHSNPDKPLVKKQSSKSWLKTIFYRRSSIDSLRSTTKFELKSLSSQNKKQSNLTLFPSRGSLDLLQDVDSEKNLALHLAIENGHFELVKLCVERARSVGWNDMVHERRLYDDSCLHIAVESNNFEIVQFLLREGIDINARNAAMVTPLMISCQQNAVLIVEYLVENGADLELTDADKISPLMISCRYGHLEVIKCLLEHSVDVTSVDKKEKSCLMYAAEENRTEALELLLENNLGQEMIEQKNKENNTALHLASMKGHNEVVKLLIDHRASLDIRNEFDRTTLHMAALHGHDVVIPILINRDRSVMNAGDEDSNTALHLAALSGNLKCTNILINLGANLEIRNSRQWTALDCAAANGWEKIVLTLLESGANIQPKKKFKKNAANKISPLLLACQRGHVNVVNILLQWKIDVTFKSSDGRNALDFAIDFGQKDCVLALLKHKTWKKSIKNAIIHPVTGKIVTPMRKLIMKMDDMAMVVCNQCVSDNGKKPNHEEYAVTCFYDMLDDMYSSTEWLEQTNTEKVNKKLSDNNFDITLLEDNYVVYDDDDGITPQAYTYTSDTNELQLNHPLKIMADYGSETLLLHPLVTSLLNYKWRQFGRYLYYFNLLVYLFFMLLLNVYMLLLPLTYRLNWLKIFEFHRFLESGRNITGINSTFIPAFQNATSSACFFYRSEVIEDTALNFRSSNCVTIPASQRNLQFVVFAFSIFNLIKEVVQMITQKRGYITFENALELILYIMSLLLTIDLSSYVVENIFQLSGGKLTPAAVQPLDNFQQETGLRLDWQEQIGAFSVFLSWLVLLLYIQIIPKVGIFVVMFTEILKTFSEFFIIFSFFVFSFALSFTILFGNQHEFERWYETLVKTTVMTIGELDYGDLFYSASESLSEVGQEYDAQIFARPVSLVLYTIFLLTMTILIANLLVGLAVGDIIEIRKNATIKSLGMQIALVLEVEFSMPEFMRKRMNRRLQIIEVNKYRDANFFRKLFYEFNLSFQDISKAVDEEEAEQDEAKSAEDKVLSSLNILRGRISDVIEEQAELKEGVRGVKTLVNQAKRDSNEHAKNLQKNIADTNDRLKEKIESTQCGLTETTVSESTVTRDRVENTVLMINTLKADLEETKLGMEKIKNDLSDKINGIQKELEKRNWNELQESVKKCKDDVDQSKSEIVESLNEIKTLLFRQKYVSSV